MNTYNVIRFDAVFRWLTTVYGGILPAFLLDQYYHSFSVDTII